MKLSELSARSIEKIKQYRLDRFIEKHEGPERWASILEYYDPEFMGIDRYHVLLPVGREHHPNITILRTIVSKDEQTLTLFLKDRTFLEEGENDFYAGMVAICDKVPGEAFFITIFYHEWYVAENKSL